MQYSGVLVLVTTTLYMNFFYFVSAWDKMACIIFSLPNCQHLNLNPLGTQNSNKIISGNNTNHMLCGFPHSNKIHSSHQITQISYGLSPSYSPLFSGTGWRCCWSEGRAHCGSPPGCGRRTRSSSVLTGAGAGSWQLRWSAWSPQQGCRSGLREGSGGSPAETKRQILNFSE